MKQIICFSLLVSLLVSFIPLNTSAVAFSESSKSIIYLDNGDYITIEIGQVVSRGTSVTNSKTYIYRGSSGTEYWRAVLKGTFTYDGTTSSCTASNCDITISDSAWSVSSKNVGKSGSTASADLTMVKKFIGITIQTENITMTLTCSPTGQFS